MSILSRACPFLARTGLSGLQSLAGAGLARGLASSAVERARCGVCPGHTGQSALLAKASQCPVVGPSLQANVAAPAQPAPATCPFAKGADAATGAAKLPRDP
ncbi:hypothetical protein IWQ57_006892, partial [Coemansia nantahalensis]